jgi:hypothetical protein
MIEELRNFSMAAHAFDVLLAVVRVEEYQYVSGCEEVHEGIADVGVLGEIEAEITKVVSTTWLRVWSARRRRLQ